MSSSPSATAAAAATEPKPCMDAVPNECDPTEVALGIACYRSPRVAGFSAVSKARFSDFAVHEIGMDGSLARLESLEAKVEGGVENDDAVEEKKPAAVAGTKRKLNDGNGNDDTTTTTTVADDDAVDWKAIQTELETLLGTMTAATKAAEVVQFLQQQQQQSSAEPKAAAEDGDPSTTPTPTKMFVQLDAITDKDTRRRLHQWIRQRLGFCANADTLDGGCLRIWHRRFQACMPHKFDNNRHSHKKQSKAPKDKPYLQFVLYKENMDTGAAMQQISKKLSLMKGGGGGRGGRGGGRGGRGRHGNNQQQQVRMGFAGNKDKRGVTSQFVTVRARDCSVQHLFNCFNDNKDRGGGHTRSGGVGLLRVGNFRYVRRELLLGRLRGNRFDVVLRHVQVDDKDVLRQAAESIRQHGFVNHFGVQRFGKYHDTHLTGMAVLKGDFEGAIDIILRPKEDERDELRQARIEWQNRFQTGIAKGGDDNKNENKQEEDRATLERNCARRVVRTLNRFMHSECAVLNSLATHPLDYKKAFSCIAKTMRMMFVHALQSYLWNKVASFRVETLGPKVIPGDLVFVDAASAEMGVEDHSSDERKESKTSLPEVKVVTEEDVVKGMYTLEDVVLPLIGINTRDPGNECGKMFDNLLEEHGLTRAMIHNLRDRHFLCTGDYRKLICRPSDVDYEILEYTDELQPLLQNDIMKLHGHKIEPLSGSGDGGGEEEKKKQRLKAMVVGFSLPSSSYATMFMRELMKRPTSSEYQRELKLGGGGEQQGDEL